MIRKFQEGGEMAAPEGGTPTGAAPEEAAPEGGDPTA